MDYKGLVNYFLKKIKRDNIGAYAGQATLFIVMSAIPFLIILLSLLRFTPVSEDMILSLIQMFIPGQISDWVVSLVEEVYRNNGIVFVSIILAVYSAAKAIQSLRYSLNIVYDIEETRNWFVLRFRAMIDTVVLILIILALMVFLMFGQRIEDMLVVYLPAIGKIMSVILKLRMIFLFFILIMFFATIYRVLPNRPATFKSQLVGAIGCSAAWYVFSFFVSIYVNYMGGFSLYGSLTTLVLLMFWLSIAIYIFLVCGEVNSQLEVILKEYKLTKKQKEAHAAGSNKEIVRIEPYTMSDVIPMMNMWNSRLETEFVLWAMEPLGPSKAAEFFAEMDYVGVVRIDEETVGFYMLHPNRDGRVKHQATLHFAIPPINKWKKIARRMMKDALAQARKFDYEMVVLDLVERDNIQTIQLLRGFGFNEIGRIPNGYMMKNGETEDLLIYHREL